MTFAAFYRLVSRILVPFLLFGCNKKTYDETNFVSVVTNANIKSLTKIEKKLKKNTEVNFELHKTLLLSELKIKPSDLIDCVFNDKFVCILLKKYLLINNVKENRSSLIKIKENTFKKIVDFSDQEIILYGQNYALCVNKNTKLKKEISTDSIISGVIKYGENKIFPQNNGSCISYSKGNELLWETKQYLPINTFVGEYSFGQGNLLIKTNENEVMKISADNGSIEGYVSVPDEMNNRFNILSLDSSICCYNDRYIFFKSKGKSKTYSLENIQQIKKNKDSIIIICKNSIYFTDEKSLSNGNYFAQVEFKNSPLFLNIEKNHLFALDASELKIIDMFSGELVKVVTDFKGKHFAYKNKIALLDNLNLKVFSIL